MNRTLCLLAVVGPALSGCGGVPVAVLSGLGSLYTVADKITEAVDPYIATGCAEYRKGKAAADTLTGAGLVPSAIAGKVTSIESFGDAACGSGSGSPAGDPLSTAIWLGQLAGQITTLTTAAK